jgi:putative peptidoglycan lipid II flippase
MVPIFAVVMLRAQVPVARAALAAFRGWIGPTAGTAPRASGRSTDVAAGKPGGGEHLLRSGIVTYPEQRDSFTRSGHPVREPFRRRHPQQPTGEGIGRGPGMTDGPSDSTASSAVSDPRSSPVADDFQPDVPPDLHVGTVAPPETSPPPNGEPSPDPALDAAAFGDGDPTGFDALSQPDGESSGRLDDQHLVPGASIASGRYRLLMFHGGAPRLQFWQALDTALNRQVALTFVDPDGTLPDDQLREILSRTMRLSRIDKPGIARVLDVVHTGTGGLVVAEWVRGGSLQEVADTSPSAVGAARAMQTLAAAAEAAHHAGVVLSIDHPSRVRVSIEGDVVLAFPATIPDTSPEDDIRGIGAALYALLVNRWPLPESGEPSGMAQAPRDPAGQPLEPRSIDREIPFQISAAATHSLQDDGGIRSAATLLNLLQQATAVADRTVLLSPIQDQGPPSTSPRTRAAREPELAEAQSRLRRRRALTIGVGAGVAVLVVALLVLASVLSRMFSDVGGLDKDQLGLNGPSASSSSGADSAAGSIVKPVRATVFSPGQEADNPGQAGLAIDGNPGTAWETDTYHDAVPFPGFKSGVGLLLQLPQPTVVGAVTVDLASTGTKIQIRAASTATPAKLENTTALTQPVATHPGHNSIPVNASSPTTQLLVWIPTLGTTNGESRSGLSEITVQAKS